MLLSATRLCGPVCILCTLVVLPSQTSLRLCISLVCAVTGVHVIMWGQVDTVNNVLDMTLGIPADTLAAIGIKTLPSDYVLPVPVKGTPQAPVVNWGK